MKFKKIPFVKQNNIMECGSACLAMLCGYYGKKYSLSFLSNYCIPSKRGLSVFAIKRAAEKLGLNCEGVMLSAEELRDIPTPNILHWNSNHFVVLKKIDNSSYHILDPGKCPMVIDEHSFMRHWISDNDEQQGVALVLKPNDRFGLISDLTSPSDSLQFFLENILKYKNFFLALAVSILLACSFQLILPYLTKSVVDVGIKNKDINFVILILLGELFIVLGKTITDFIRSWLILRFSMKININLLSRFFLKLLNLPMGYFDIHLTGDFIQRISDHTKIQSFLTRDILNFLYSFVSIFIFSIILFTYNFKVFTIFCVGSFAYFWWSIYFLKKRKVLDYEIFEIQSTNQDKTLQLITNIQEIKLQNCEKRKLKEWEDSQKGIFSVQTKSLKLQQIQQSGAIFLIESKNIIITAIAGSAVIDNQISLGTLLAIQMIIGQLNSPIEKIVSIIYSLQDAYLSLTRVNEIHNLADEDNESKIIQSPIQHTGIIFSNVWFNYNPGDEDCVLRNVSFEVPENKITAIVGSSGSGKTTIIKLILGYYRITNGDILLNNLSISSLDMRSWRKQCGTVLQESVIFPETIARNIAISEDKIDYTKVFNAAKLACIDSFIETLPFRYETKLGNNGIGLSQGQKQRILIARAIYKNPRYIFFDEATNALDANNEKDIVDNLYDFFKEKTVVVAAHRLSTIRKADQIIVIENGEIAEIGKHDSLIKTKGKYYNLVKSQIELIADK